MIEALSTPRNRWRTLILFLACVLLTVAATFVGIEDNLPGILLAFLATIAFVLTFAHPWQTSRKFVRLFFASLVCLVLFGALYIGLDIGISRLAAPSLVHDLLAGLSAILFAVLLVCPAAVLVGAFGAAVMASKNRPKAR